jgi:hypothetical protein
MEILLNLFKEQANQETWLKNGERLKTLLDFSKIHSGTLFGKWQIFQVKTE